ncbi:Alkyl sulfatase BDS1, metallo-beta-lactamase superfamily [Candidatus Methanophagaceae archaeon]|nr:Alkyl sulfatase BDS1, metallo-beta-lactamase superfamily [Methanophagales archaeon]
MFEGGVIAENLISGVAMARRAEYMYAIKLGQGELGQLETGGGSNRGFDGSTTLVLPTETFDSLHLIISMIPKIPEYIHY